MYISFQGYNYVAKLYMSVHSDVAQESGAHQTSTALSFNSFDLVTTSALYIVQPKP